VRASACQPAALRGLPGQLQLDGCLNLFAMFLPQSLFCFALIAALIPAISTLAKSSPPASTVQNRHRNLQSAVIVVDLFDVAVEIRKRAIDDAHLLVRSKTTFGFAVLRRVHALMMPSTSASLSGDGESP